jgi:hypothetical protein
VRLSITRVSRGRIAIVSGALPGGGATDVDMRLAYVTERGAKHARTRTVRARNGRFTTRFTKLRSSRIRVTATTRL